MCAAARAALGMAKDLHPGIAKVLARVDAGELLKDAWTAEGQPTSWPNILSKHHAAWTAAQAALAAPAPGRAAARQFKRSAAMGAGVAAAAPTPLKAAAPQPATPQLAQQKTRRTSHMVEVDSANKDARQANYKAAHKAATAEYALVAAEPRLPVLGAHAVDLGVCLKQSRLGRLPHICIFTPVCLPHGYGRTRRAGPPPPPDYSSVPSSLVAGDRRREERWEERYGWGVAPNGRNRRFSTALTAANLAKRRPPPMRPQAARIGPGPGAPVSPHQIPRAGGAERLPGDSPRLYPLPILGAKL